MVLVFAEELDASTVVPNMLLVVRADGRRVHPQTVTFWPANEADENRTLWLSGDWSAEALPRHVIVNGPLYAESGASFQGATRSVQGSERPCMAVALQAYAKLAACEGPGVRTFWSRTIVKAQPAGVTLRARGGRRWTTAVDVSDGADASSAVSEQPDNVVDYCTEELWVEGEVIFSEQAALDMQQTQCMRRAFVVRNGEGYARMVDEGNER